MHVQSIINTSIIDIGTTTTKAGYASSIYPSICTPSSTSQNNYTSPLNHSQVQDMDNFLALLQSHSKQIPSNDLIVVLNNEPRLTKERIIEFIYETGTIENLLLHESTLLSLFAYGKTSGIVIEISESISVAGIIGGLIASQKSFKYGGREVTDLFQRPEIVESVDRNIDKLQRHLGRPLSDNKRLFMIKDKVREVKEHILALSHDEARTYELFGQPLLFESEYEASMDLLVADIKEAVREIVDACAEEHKYILLSNIVLSGGGSNINGIADRINMEVCKVFPQPKVKVTQERNFHPFLGASVLGSLGSVKAFFIGKRDYDECGSNILEHKNMSWSLK